MANGVPGSLPPRAHAEKLFSYITIILVIFCFPGISGSNGAYSEKDLFSSGQPVRDGTISVSAWTFPWDNSSYVSLKEWGNSLSIANPYWYWSLPNGTVVQAHEKAEDLEYITFCRVNGISIIPMVSNNHDPALIINIAHDPSFQQRHIGELLNTTLRWNYEGLDINYENVPTAEKGAYSSFIKNLSVAFHGRGRSVHVSVFPKVYAGEDREGPGGYDYLEIGRWADKVKIMAYNLHWSTCEDSGPITSYDWVSRVLDYAVNDIPLSKIVLGVPLFSYDWVIRPDGKTLSIATNLSYEQIEELQNRYSLERKWNATSRTPYFEYRDTRWNLHALHYCDAETLMHELVLVREYGLSGISLWKLGGEDPLASYYMNKIMTEGISNMPPFVRVPGDITGMRGTSISLGPIRAYDIDGILEFIEWDFGDGLKSPEIEPEHMYMHGGFFTAGLTVIDDRGSSIYMTRDLKIGPYPKLSRTGNLKTGSVSVFNATGSWDPYGIVSYSWDLGDGTYLFHAGPVISHIYSRPGAYRTSLTVINTNGFTETIFLDLFIPDMEVPIAMASEDITVWEDAIVTLDGRRSFDNSGELDFLWHFPDGTKKVGDVVEHLFNEPGTYSVVLEVTDPSGKNDTEEVIVKVRDRTSPSIALTCPLKVNIGDTIVLSCEGSLDNVGITNISWRSSDGMVFYGGMSFSIAADKARSIYVTLDMMDAERNWNSTTVRIDIVDIDPPSASVIIDPEPYPLESTYLAKLDISKSPLELDGIDGVLIENLTYRFRTTDEEDDSGIGYINWSFGDGGSAKGPLVYHEFGLCGLYHVSLSVEDLFGNRFTEEFVFLVVPARNLTIEEHRPVNYHYKNDTILINRTETDSNGWLFEISPMVILVVIVCLITVFSLAELISVGTGLIWKRSPSNKGKKDKLRPIMVLILLSVVLLSSLGSPLLKNDSYKPIDLFPSVAAMEGDEVDEVEVGPTRTDDGTFYQYRSMWLDGYEIVNISEVKKVVDFARKYNFNCLSPLVNGNYYGVYYNSSYVKKHKDVAWNFDPLMELIKEAHKYGIQVHPWFHTLYDYPATVAHPEWRMVSSGGTSTYYWMNPSLPQVRNYLVNITKELFTKYPLDGIKLDTLRFPGTSYSYDAYSLKKFQDEGWTDFSAFRRTQVNEVTELIYDTIMSIRPYAWVSADVWQDYNSWYNGVFQESRVWTRDGYIDYLTTMSYTTSRSSFEANLKDYILKSSGVPIVAGPYVFVPGNTAHGSVPSETAGIDLLLNQTETAIRVGAMGVCLFSLKFLRSYPSYAQALLDGPFSQPAKCPVKEQRIPVKQSKWDFTTDHDTQGWRLEKAGYFVPMNGVWSVTNTITPSFTSPLLNISGEGTNVIEISMKAESNIGALRIYWSSLDAVFDTTKMMEVQLVGSGDWNLYSIHMDPHMFWTEWIRYIRIMPVFDKRVNVTIDLIHLYWMPYSIRTCSYLGPFITGDPQDLIEREFIRSEGKFIPLLGNTTSGRVWSDYHMERDMMDLRFVLGHLNNAATYAHVFVRSDADRTVQLRTGSSDSLKVWLNGQEVQEISMVRHIGPDSNITSVDLRKGINSLFIKIAVFQNDVAFFVRFTDMSNRTMEGLDYFNDLPAPEAPIMKDGIKGWTSQRTLSFEWTQPSSVSRIIGYEVSLDDAPLEWVLSNGTTMSGISTGHHEVKVRAVDELGFRSEFSNISFGVDDSVPEISVPVPEGRYSTTRSLTWTWEALNVPISNMTGYFVDVTYYYSDPITQSHLASPVLVNDTRFTLWDHIFNGYTYNVEVKATAGNGLYSIERSVLPTTVDLTPPVSPQNLNINLDDPSVRRYSLSWDPSAENVPDGLDHYEVWERDRSSEWTLLQETVGTRMEFQRPLYSLPELKVRAVDRAGLTGHFSLPTMVENSAPTAVISEPERYLPGEPSIFSGNGSLDTDGKVVEYRWYLDGDLVSETEEAALTLERGEYYIRLEVKDDLGSTDKASMFARLDVPMDQNIPSLMTWLIEGSKKDVFLDPMNITVYDNRTETRTVNDTASVERRELFSRLSILSGYVLLLLLTMSIVIIAVLIIFSIIKAPKKTSNGIVHGSMDDYRAAQLQKRMGLVHSLSQIRPAPITSLTAQPMAPRPLPSAPSPDDTIFELEKSEYVEEEDIEIIYEEDIVDEGDIEVWEDMDYLLPEPSGPEEEGR